MADPTAKAICDMFEIDTSTASDEAASALAIQAVSGLVTSYGELRQQLPDDYTEDDDIENVDDEETDPNEVNEDGTEEGDDVEPEEDDDVEPTLNTQRKKGANVPAQPIAASFPPSLIKNLSRGRIAEINGLVSAGYATPAAAKKLIKDFATDQAIGLSLSMESDDGFERAVSLLKANGPVLSYQEITGHQADFSTLGHGDGLVCSLEGSDLKDETKNPLLADAARRNSKK